MVLMNSFIVFKTLSSETDFDNYDDDATVNRLSSQIVGTPFQQDIEDCDYLSLSCFGWRLFSFEIPIFNLLSTSEQ